MNVVSLLRFLRLEFTCISFPTYSMNKLLAASMAAALSMTVAVPVFADEDSSSSSSSSSSVSSSSSSDVESSSSSSSSENGRMKAKEKGNRKVENQKKNVDIACVQPAVAKREAALLASVDTYYSVMKSAMSVRASALNAAWSLTDASAREAAIKAAHAAYRTSAKTATATLRTARKGAWKTFKADAKVCKVSLPRAESDAEKTDTAL